MKEMLKTGLCALMLLLALTAACLQEISFQQDPGRLVQPAPFAAAQLQ